MIKGGWSGKLLEWVNRITIILAPFAAAIGFLASKLGEYLKSAIEFENHARANCRLSGQGRDLYRRARCCRFSCGFFISI